jgi:hypothetical protein
MPLSKEYYEHSILLARYLGYTVSSEKTPKGYQYKISSPYLQHGVLYGMIAQAPDDASIADTLWVLLLSTDFKATDWRNLIMVYSTYKKQHTNLTGREHHLLTEFIDAVGENDSSKAFIALVCLIQRLKNESDDWDALGKII